MEFEHRNEAEIQGMVDRILQIANNGLEWARARESEWLASVASQNRPFVATPKPAI